MCLCVVIKFRRQQKYRNLLYFFQGLTVEGEILVNGQSVGKSVTSVSAYVQQEDIFVGTLTVKKICLKKESPRKLLLIKRYLRSLR